MKISVRPALDSDVDTLVRLNAVVQRIHAVLEPGFFKAVPDDAEVAAFFAAQLPISDNRFCLAECDGQESGYIWFEKQDRPETALTRPMKRLYVHHIGVDEAYQRKGVASALLRHVEAEALASGIQRIVLGTWVANQSARVFFQSHGFAPFSLVLGKSVG
jgi:ribosomal protein S18 acetylase RimI-like enzyme